jgi:signal transduction histidine kinase
MRSLFLKIFLWFWLTNIGVGLVVSLSVAFSTGTTENQLRAAASEVFPDGAAAAASKFESGGEPALSGYLSSVEAKYSVRTFFFNSEGQEILSGWGLASHVPPPTVSKAAALAREREGVVYLQDEIAVQRVQGPSGRQYVLLLSLNPVVHERRLRAPAAMKLAFTFLPLISIVVGGAFCYVITRHITKPLVRMREATAGIARGDLATRVGPSLGRRRDEIAALGADFDRMAERIQALVAGQKRMLGDVSHELRSPLSRLLVALGLAKRSAPPELSEPLDRIGLEARRLDHLIGQLLTLSRIDSGAQTPMDTPVDLANLIQEIAADGNFEARAGSRSVTVTAAQPCTIAGSEDLLRAAIENVVRNAVRFTAVGTAVEISLFRRDGKIILQVHDHGPGVPENMLAEIFLPFRRAPSSGDTAPEGAGLGLAIAQRAVSLHGGTIQAFNDPAGGLTVQATFPQTVLG